MGYIIGFPGAEARMYINSSEEIAAMQLAQGEVYVPVDGPGQYEISSDGTTACMVETSSNDAWFLIRNQRGNLLTACDWTQLPDVPEATRAAWVSYRQALRDITETFSDPADVVWPPAPDATL